MRPALMRSSSSVKPLTSSSRSRLRGPLAELRAARRPDAVADGEDHVEVVVQRSVVLAVGGSCQVFLDNCFGPQLLIVQDVLNVQTDVLLGV